MAILKREFQKQCGHKLKLRGAARILAGAPSDATKIGTVTFNDTSNDFYVSISATAATASHKKLD